MEHSVAEPVYGCVCAESFGLRFLVAFNSPEQCKYIECEPNARETPAYTLVQCRYVKEKTKWKTYAIVIVVVATAVVVVVVVKILAGKSQL